MDIKSSGNLQHHLAKLRGFACVANIHLVSTTEWRWILTILGFALFWIPFYLQEAYNLVRAYEGKTV